MPGSRWDPIRSLNKSTNRVEWPTGDVDPEKETLIRLEATVMQSSTGATQTTVDTAFKTKLRWTADQNSQGPSQAKSQSGPATGIALLITKDSTGTDNLTWWLSVFDLV